MSIDLPPDNTFYITEETQIKNGFVIAKSENLYLQKGIDVSSYHVVIDTESSEIRVTLKEGERYDQESLSGFIVYETFFDFDSHDLKTLDEAKIKQLDDNLQYIVLGYADPTGTSQYNQTLSQKRADILAEHLRKRGLNIKKALGLGEIEKSNYDEARTAILLVQ